MESNSRAQHERREVSSFAHTDILAVLESTPSYPRAIAELLGRPERQVQKCLGDLSRAGRVASHWKHTDRTFKEYTLVRGDTGMQDAGTASQRKGP